MKDAIMEDFHSDFLFGKFSAGIVENNNRYRIVPESRGSCSLWIPTLDPITLGFASTQNPSLFDFYDSVF